MAQATRKRLKLGSRQPVAIGELLGVVEYLEKEKRRQTRFWKKTQNDKGQWCAFHHGVMWGLHVAIKRINREDA